MSKIRFIGVEGADGTGKTTFIEGLTKAIEDSEKQIALTYHHRPSILPNLGVIGERAKVMKADKDFTNPHRAEPSGFFGSLCRMSYYWLDYFIGMPYILRKRNDSKIFIFDRYIYDFLIDPRRSRISLPYFIRFWFTKLVIQPDIVFILLTDSKTIFERKQELTIKEIDRQLIEFSKLAKSNDRFVILDAKRSPKEVVEEAMAKLSTNSSAF